MITKADRDYCRGMMIKMCDLLTELLRNGDVSPEVFPDVTYARAKLEQAIAHISRKELQA